jgi:hypothetical protein
MEPKFIVVGDHWINVSMIANVEVNRDVHGTIVTIFFSSSPTLPLQAQEAQEFISKLMAFQVS